MFGGVGSGNRQIRGRREQTRYKLAQSLKECMKTAPVERITVQDIVDGCGVSRQTFYRNFRDKYDLIEWYFDELALQSFVKIGQGDAVVKSLTQKFLFMQAERTFFIGAFRSDDQHYLMDHDFNVILWFYRKWIKEKTGKPLTEEIDFMLELYCHGCVYMNVKWVLGGMKESPEELAHLVALAMPTKLADLIESFRYL